MGPPTALRWFVTAADRPPPVMHALFVAERVRATVKGVVEAALGRLPPELSDHAPDGGLPRGDPHPFYLPEDADGDGLVDHVVLVVPGGLDPAWRGLLERLVPATSRGTGLLPPFALTADWLGHAGGLAPAPGALLGPARAWTSATPYVPDLHLKKGFGLLDAFLRDLDRRGYPVPEARAVAWRDGLAFAGGTLAPGLFATARLEGEKRVARSRHPGAFLRVEFPLPVRGPVAAGFACHLGLGAFAREGGVLGTARPATAATVRDGRPAAWPLPVRVD